MKIAVLYKKLAKESVECSACAHRCRIKPGKTGLCGVRRNFEGKLCLLTYGRAIALQVDPIEKKPFFHFLPGSKAYSIGTLGCNFRCRNCQNFDISQIFGYKGKVGFYDKIDWGQKLSAKEAVRQAKEFDCQSIAYTYNEPTIWAEYALSIMKPAKKAGLKNVWVSNGFMTRETLDLIVPYLDAINVDIKSFDDEFYVRNCGARLKPVLETCQRLVEKKIHLEITTLIIPTLSDQQEMLGELAKFIKIKLGADIPWHLSAFSGMVSWQLQDLSETPLKTLEAAYKIGKKEGLKNIYLGNVATDGLENTYCFKCGEIVIKRNGYSVTNHCQEGKCPKCQTKIMGDVS